MFFCLPATHVYADFGNYGLRSLHFDAVDSCKVHARDAVQLPAKIKTRLDFRENPLWLVQSNKIGDTASSIPLR